VSRSFATFPNSHGLVLRIGESDGVDVKDAIARACICAAPAIPTDAAQPAPLVRAVREDDDPAHLDSWGPSNRRPDLAQRTLSETVEASHSPNL